MYAIVHYCTYEDIPLERAFSETYSRCSRSHRKFGLAMHVPVLRERAAFAVRCSQVPVTGAEMLKLSLGQLERWAEWVWDELSWS